MGNQQFATQHGLIKPPGITDAQFNEWLNSLHGNSKLILQAKNICVPVQFGITVPELKKAIFDRQRRLLEEKGIKCKSKVSYRGRMIEIHMVIVDEVKLKITICYWILDWANRTNKGRANSTSAARILEGL